MVVLTTKFGVREEAGYWIMSGLCQYKNLCACVFCLTCDRVLASVALLGHIGLEAVHAVNVVLVRSEATFRQRFTAGVAHEALGVPGVVLVADPSRADWLRSQTDHRTL